MSRESDLAEIRAFADKHSRHANNLLIPAINQASAEGCDARALVMTLLIAAVNIRNQNPSRIRPVEEMLPGIHADLALAAKRGAKP